MPITAHCLWPTFLILPSFPLSPLLPMFTLYAVLVHTTLSSFYQDSGASGWERPERPQNAKGRHQQGGKLRLCSSPLLCFSQLLPSILTLPSGFQNTSGFLLAFLFILLGDAPTPAPQQIHRISLRTIYLLLVSN